MGTWGIGISSNDTYADTYEEFFDLYNEGLTSSEVTRKLIEQNQETIQTREDAPNFWFAIAKAQWECKDLQNEILATVENLIKSGEDLKIWKELDATDADIKARGKVLDKFLVKLQSAKDNPRKRTKKKFYDSIFKKGDCLTYLMENGNYGGAFVLADETQTAVGGNFIAITDINKNTKPVLDDFKKSFVYIKRSKDIYFENQQPKEKWNDHPQIGLFAAINFKKAAINIEIIGQLKIYREYQRENRFWFFGWDKFINDLPNKNEYVKLNGEPKSKLKLSKWVKRYWL